MLLSTRARRAAKSTGSMPSGASSRLASARRSMMWPQRETSGLRVPASAARTIAPGCARSEAVGSPPSSGASSPTCSVERWAAGGMSKRGLRPSSSSSWSASIRSSSSIEGRPGGRRIGASGPAPGVTPGIGWITGVPVGDGAGAAVAVARGVGVGAGAGSSNPGGNSDSGACCATLLTDIGLTGGGAGRSPRSR
ncbi:hypothetical protein J4558_27055 [Leptolyngbya sp. 15MV]|nr:hypothetical protein J4558_27055 [Leptolyngbya sp. 15MV]